MKLKSRFMLILGFFLVVLIIASSLYTLYMQSIDIKSEYLFIQLAILCSLILILISIFIILKGYYYTGTHLMLITGYTCVWLVMIVDKTHILSRLNTISYAIALVSLITLVIKDKKYPIFIYPGANIAALAGYMYYFNSELNLPLYVLVDHISGNIISMIGASIVGYNIFLINKRSLERAESEIKTRELTEKTLRENEEKYRLLADNASDIIFTVDLELRFKYISPSVVRLRGFTVEEALAQTARDALTPESMINGARALHDELEKEAAGNADPHRTRVLELEQRCKDGSTIWTETTFSGLRNEHGVLVGFIGITRDISQRKKTESELIKSEALNRRIIDTAMEGILRMDGEHRITYVNKRISELLGYSMKELLGINIELLLFENDLPDHKIKMENRKKNLSDIYERRFKCKNGNEKWFIISAVPIMDIKREYAGSFAMLTDITERKKTEEMLKAEELRLYSLLSLSQKSYRLSEKDIIQSALEEAVILTGSKIGYCHFVNEDQETIELVCWSRETLKECTAAPEKHYPLSSAGVWADSARMKMPVIHNNYNNLPEKRGLPRGHSEVGRHLSVPVIEDDRVRVIMGVGNKNLDYTNTDVRQLQLSANETWKIIRRKRIEEALKESEHRYRHLLSNIPDVIFSLDDEGRISYISPPIESISGYSTSEIIGKNFIEIVHQPDRPVADSHIKSVMSGKDSTSEYRIKSKSGDKIWIRISSHPDMINGKVKGLQGTITDITDRKNAEAEQGKLTAIIETSSDLIGIADLAGKMLYINEAGKRMLGLDSPDMVPAITMSDFIIPEDSERVISDISANSLEKNGCNIEFRIKNFSINKSIPVEMNAFSITEKETGESIALAVIIRDITERKRSERALIELATSDPLTGIFNRRRFFELSSKEFKNALLNSLNLSVLMIDADHFKDVNDKYGHAIGDQVLTGIVVRLKKCLRDSDILARYGGEEFVILMPGADIKTASVVAERLREEVKKSPIPTSRVSLPITISIGVSVLIENIDLTIDDLVNRADQAMYEAKNSGRDCVRLIEKTLSK
jgi:diguanylate cyclase (GGDEF)-like protein/PAS domain S-box-containing protein